MWHSAAFAFVLVFLIYSVNVSLAKEPVCSKFPYEEQLLEKMIRTEIKVEMMETEIKNTLNEIKKTVSGITDNFEDLRNSITNEMDAKIKDIETEEEFFKNTFEELRTSIANDMENQRKTISELKVKTTRPSVAFYAHHVTDVVQDETDEIIVFDSTLTNEGSGYDTSTGIFTAPIGGMYQFIVHICTHYQKYSFIGLVLEGKIVAAASNYDATYDTCSSTGAIIKVESGEKIWVKCTWASASRRLSGSDYTMNTFGGILLNNE